MHVAVRNHRRPTFFWQGFLILLPVAVLAMVSLVSLRRDEAAARREAENRAAQNVQALAHSLRLTLNAELQEYLTLQNVWMLGLRLASQPSVSGIFPDEKLKADIRRWEKAYPQFMFTNQVTSLGYILNDGRQIEPPEIPATPRPPKWFRDLSPEQQRLWDDLRRTVDSNADPATIRNASEDFLKTSPSAAAQAAARDLISPSMVSWYGSSPMESGITFQDAACYRFLKKSDGPDRSRSDALWRRLFESPSFAAPALFQLAASRPEWAADEKVRWMAQLWKAQSRSREWLAPLRRSPGLTNHWDPPAFWAAWTGDEGRDALAFLDPSTFTNMGVDPEGVPFAGHGYDVWLVPGEIVDAMFAKALADNRFLVPDYVRLEVTVEGRRLPGSGTGAASGQAVLGTAHEKIGPAMVPRGADLDLRFYLTDPGKMLSAERRREKLFALLILGAALAALAGLWAARRAFQRQLQLSEMKSNFVSSVSHELRAPIASVRLMAENLERGHVAEADRRNDYFRFIRQECRRLGALIENILDFSRIEQGRKQYEFEPTDLTELVQQTVRLMEPYAAEKGVRLALNLSPGAESIEKVVDGRAIQQAFVNLIDNAIKHSPSGETVTVEFSGSGAGCRWSVTDRGPGIPAGEQQKIFERFYRRGSELRRETQGIGIGLSIVKHIVEAHGGCVLVESAPGNGSRFTVELPTNEPKETKETKR